jgi:hypothetical protein
MPWIGALPECMYSALQLHLESILLQLRIKVPAQRGIFGASGAGAEWTSGWTGSGKGGSNIFEEGEQMIQDGEGTFVELINSPKKKIVTEEWTETQTRLKTSTCAFFPSSHYQLHRLISPSSTSGLGYIVALVGHGRKKNKQTDK